METFPVGVQGDCRDLDRGLDLAAVRDGGGRERQRGGAGDEVGAGPVADQIGGVYAAEA